MKVVRLLFFAILIFFFASIIKAQNPNFEWAKQIDGNSNAFGRSVVVDSIGNVYTTGYFAYTFDFDPGPGVFNITAKGQYDVFVLKLDSLGNFLWAKSVGGPSGDLAFTIVLDKHGDVIVGGYFNDTVDFNPGVGINMFISNGVQDAFVLKLSPAGNFIWTKTWGGAWDDDAFSITVEPSNNIYVAGKFRDSVDFDPGPGTLYYFTNSWSHGFISKLDPFGNLIWANDLGQGNDYSTNCYRSVQTDGMGNVCITGYYTDTIDFDFGMGVFNMSPIGNPCDAFVCKLNPSGNLIWAKDIVLGFAGGSTDDVTWLDIDTLGNVYVCGFFSDSANFDPGISNYSLTSSGSKDIFVLKLDAMGNFVWAKQMGGAGDDRSYTIATDISGNVYTSGFFNATADFNPSAAIVNLTSFGGQDVFISKLDASGNYNWVKQLGGTSHEDCFSVKVDSFGTVYTTGYFLSTVDFDPSPATFFLTATSGSVFIHKMGFACYSNSMINITACSQYTSPSGNQTWSQSGEYTDVIVNGKGCDSIITINLIIISVDTSVTQSSNILTSNLTGAIYQWINCNNNQQVVGETNQTFIAVTNGTYAVIVTKNGCTDTSACHTISTVGLAENRFLNPISVHPNPSNGNFNIDFGILLNEVEIEVINGLGQKVLKQKINNSKTVNIELNQPQGIYLLSVILISGERKMITLVKE